MKKIFFIPIIIFPLSSLFAGGDIQEGSVHKHIASLEYYAAAAAHIEKPEPGMKYSSEPIQRGYLIKQLLKQNSSPFKTNDQFWYKAKKDTQEKIRDFLSHKEIFEKNYNREAIISILNHIDAPHEGALLLASRYGLLSIVEKHIWAGIDKNKALLKVTRRGHTNTVKLLLEYNADIHTLNDSILIELAREGEISVAQFLVEKGVDTTALIKYENDLDSTFDLGLIFDIEEVLKARYKKTTSTN